LEEVARHDPARPAVLNLELNETFGQRQVNGIKKIGLVTTGGLDAVEQALHYIYFFIVPGRNHPGYGTSIFMRETINRTGNLEAGDIVEENGNCSWRGGSVHSEQHFIFNYTDPKLRPTI